MECTLQLQCSGSFRRTPSLSALSVSECSPKRIARTSSTKKVTELQPKADFFDAFRESRTHCTNTGVPRRRSLAFRSANFADFFRTPDSWIRWPGGGISLPYNRPENEGLFIVRDFYSQYGHHGTYTLITSMGKNLLRELLIPERKDA